MALPIIQNVASPLSIPTAWRAGGWEFDLTREGDSLRVDDTWDEVLFTLRGPEFGGSFSLRQPDPFDSNKGTILYNPVSELWELDFFTEFGGDKFPPNIPTGAWIDVTAKRLPTTTGNFDGTWLTQYPRVFDSALRQNTDDLIKPKKYVMTLPHRQQTFIAPFEDSSNALSIKTITKTTIPYDVEYRADGFVRQFTDDPKIGEFTEVTTDGTVWPDVVTVFATTGTGVIDEEILFRKGTDGPFQTIDNLLKVTGPDVFTSTGIRSVLIEMTDSNGSDVVLSLAMSIKPF